MSQGEKPRSAPEIIPPDRSGRRDTPRERVFVNTQGTERVYITRIGPFGLFLAMLLTGIVLAVMFGAMLIWLPLLIAFIVGATIAGFLRGYFRRGP